MENNFARRSLLFVPGNSTKMIAKSAETPTDSIIFDLEDSVIPAEKVIAREYVTDIIKKIRNAGKEIIVRVNAVDTLCGINDLLDIAKARPHAFIIPKANVAAITTADIILKGLECDLGIKTDEIKLIPLLESADSILNSYCILTSANRIDGVQLGAEDLTIDLNIERTKESEEIRYAREMIVYSACACKNNIDIIDTPFTDVVDIKGLEKDAFVAKSIGFTGKACIHPNQIETINRVFNPDREHADYAKRMVDAFNIAVSEGKGTCMFEGKMIDRPIVERAKKMWLKQ